MSHQHSDHPPDLLLQMDLRPSALLQGVLILSHLLAIFALWWIDARLLPQLGVTAWLALSCRRHLQSLTGISCLHMRPGEVLLGKDGQMIPVMLKDAPWCNEWLQVLQFTVVAAAEPGAAGSVSGVEPLWQRLRRLVRQRWEQRSLSLVILPDSASAQSRRRLRVLLRWHRFSSGVPAQAGSASTVGSRGSRMVSFASGSRPG